MFQVLCFLICVWLVLLMFPNRAIAWKVIGAVLAGTVLLASLFTGVLVSRYYKLGNSSPGILSSEGVSGNVTAEDKKPDVADLVDDVHNGTISRDEFSTLITGQIKPPPVAPNQVSMPPVDDDLLSLAKTVLKRGDINQAQFDSIGSMSLTKQAKVKHLFKQLVDTEDFQEKIKELQEQRH